MPDTTSNNKRIAKNTVFLYFRTFIILLISLYTSRVVLDVLGETDFGIYNLVGGIVVLFSFMTTALSTATQRFLNYELGKNNMDEAHRIFSMSITIHIILAILIFILGETLGLWFVLNQLSIPDERYYAAFWVYQFSVIGCCVKIMRIPYSAAVVAYEQMSFYAYSSIVDALLRLAIVVFLMFVGFDKLIVYSILMFVIIVVLNIVYYFYCKRYFTICKYQFFWDKRLFSKLMSFSGWSMMGSLANVGATQGISVLLNRFHGLSLNAALGIATQVQGAFSAFVSSFQTAFSPQIIKTYASNEKEEFIKLICRSSRLSYCLIFLFAPAVIVCINPILNLWLIDVPEYTNSFVIIFIIYMMIDAISGPLWVSVQATGEIKKYQILISSIILANIPIMLVLLLMKMSPVIVVSIRAILNLVTHIIRIWYLRRKMFFPSAFYWKDVMLRCSVMTVLSFPLCFKLIDYVNRGFVFALVVIVLIIIQNSFLVAFLGVSSDERKKIINVLRSKLLRDYERK